MPTNILITGANGFLARTVARQAPAHWRLVGLVRPASVTKADDTNLQRRYDSMDALESGEKQIDGVIHLAAHIPRDMQQFEPQLLRANVELPAQLILRFPAARHVLASSVSVYGHADSLPLSIASSTDPVTPYGRSKLDAEERIRMAASHAVLRLSSIIGRGMRSGSFVDSAVLAARTGSIRVFGDGSRLQDYIDVRDAASMCISAMQRSDNFVTLAVSGLAHSNTDVARELAGLTGASIQYIGDDASASFSYTLAGAIDLGPCRHSLRATLADMVME